MRPLVSLCMMVCDEAKTIRVTLESAKPFIDQWTILDTGSADGTPEQICSSLEKIEGDLYHGAFANYAETRNRVLDLASEDPSVFTLMLSADETLEGGELLLKFLEEHRESPEGAYAVTMVNGAQEWPYTRVLRTDAKWRYQGKIHEQPVGPDGQVDAPLIPGVRVVFKESDLARKQKRIREVDLPLLTEIVNDESKTYADRARAMYYLADTHAMIAGDWPKKEDGQPDQPDQRSAWLTHSMLAMSYYWRYAQITEDPANTAHDREKAMRGYFFYYHIGDKIGFWAPQELVSRLDILCETAPCFGMAHFLRADVASRIDIRLGLKFALDAAKVAREERENPPPHAAIDTRTEWLCLRIAALCAKALASHSQARDLARRAVDAGAPKEAFRDLL